MSAGTQGEATRAGYQRQRPTRHRHERSAVAPRTPVTVPHTAGARRIDPARCSSPQPARSPTAAAAGILGVAGFPPRVHLRGKALRCYNGVSRGRSEPSNGQRATRADPGQASSVGPDGFETRAEPARYAVLPAVQTRRAIVRRAQTCLVSAPVSLVSRGAYHELGRRQACPPRSCLETRA